MQRKNIKKKKKFHKNKKYKRGNIMRYLILIFTIIILSSTTWALDTPDDEANKLYQKAYNNILDKNWDEAIDQFRELLKKYSNSSWEDDSEFWMCYAQEKK